LLSKIQEKIPMKFRHLIISFICPLIFTLITGCVQPESESQNSIEGVWEYVEDNKLTNVSGMSFFAKNHFAFVVNYKSSDLDTGQNILAYSGTYVLHDSIVTATIHYAHNRALVGQNIRWIHGVEDQYARYDVLDKNGNIVESGKVRRLE
jgi:hypothetical protein